MIVPRLGPPRTWPGKARIACAAVGLSLLAIHAALAEPTASAYVGLDPATFARIRAGFYAATGSLEATGDAIALMDASFKGDRAAWPAIIRAYRAVLEGLLGKHDKNLQQKFFHVNNAISSFGNLVETWPESIEIRFLRYAFYSQLPGIFGVESLVQPDLEALLGMYERGGDGEVPRRQLLDMAEWLRTEGGLAKSEQSRLAVAVSCLR